jgi:predicted dehydrogenase
MKKKLNTAIVGFGLSGRVFHAPFIHVHPGFHLAKVVERHSENAKEIYPDVKIVRDLKDVLDDKFIDLVVIGTPNIYHYEMAKACLEAGKHIVVEKPFMPTSAEADKIIELANSKGLHVFVYQNRRWDGDFQTIQKLLEGNLLGDIQYFEAHFDRYSPQRKRAAWRDELLPGSGILFDLGSHLIDQVLSLFGNPLSVKADIQSQRENSKVDDFFEVELGYPNMKAMVTAGMLVEKPELRYLVNGSKGSFVKYGIDPQEAALKDGKMPGEEEWGQEPAENWGIVTFVNNQLYIEGKVETIQGNYTEFYENVYQVVVNEAIQVVKPEEARNVIRVIELAFESANTKSEVKFRH